MQPTSRPVRLSSRSGVPQRSRRGRVARTTVALGLAALIASSCGSDDGDVAAGASTTTPTSSTPDETTTTGAAPPTAAPSLCDTDGWQTFETAAFTFEAPGAVVDREAQGIDSLVGEYEGAGLTIRFDFGWYSTDFADLAEHSTSEDVVIDGFPARLIDADIEGVDGYDSFDAAFMTALHVPDVELTEESEITQAGSSTSLAMDVVFDDASLAPTAECILRSVDFSA